MRQNPLIVPILKILKQATDKIGEYDLIQELERQGIVFPLENADYNMSIFKKHFMTMNALYHLQQELVEDGYYLNISALDIRIEPVTQSGNHQDLMDSAEYKVRDYYLDWTHFDNTTEADIDELLSGFWQKYFAFDRYGDALLSLELNAGAGWSDIKTAYRRLAAEHHPDKGGTNHRFIEIREAYEMLRCYYSKID